MYKIFFKYIYLIRPSNIKVIGKEGGDRVTDVGAVQCYFFNDEYLAIKRNRENIQSYQDCPDLELQELCWYQFCKRLFA